MGYITEKSSGKYADYYSEKAHDLKSRCRHSAPRQAHPKSDILLSLRRSEQYMEICILLCRSANPKCKNISAKLTLA